MGTNGLKIFSHLLKKFVTNMFFLQNKEGFVGFVVRLCIVVFSVISYSRMFPREAIYTVKRDTFKYDGRAGQRHMTTFQPFNLLI